MPTIYIYMNSYIYVLNSFVVPEQSVKLDAIIIHNVHTEVQAGENDLGEARIEPRWLDSRSGFLNYHACITSQGFLLCARMGSCCIIHVPPPLLSVCVLVSDV